MVDGKEVVMQLKAGDRVITGKYTGTEVKIDGEEYTIVRQYALSQSRRVIQTLRNFLPVREAEPALRRAES